MGGPNERDTDCEVVEACLSGKPDDFARLVERYKGMVFSLAYRMTGNSWDAEDLSQEAFLRAYRNLGAFDKTRKFSTWLYTITLNICRDRARRKRLVMLSLDRRRQEAGGLPMQVASAEPGPEERVEAREDADILQKCLLALARSDRELILLRYQLGLAYEAIAETLNVPVNRVKVRLHRARARLRKRFDKARK